MDITTCSFSGHREIFRIHAESLPRLLSDIVDTLIESGVSRFCSGGAVGFDLLAAGVVLEKKAQGADVSLSMILPCPEQAKSWPTEEKALYDKTLSLADEVIYTSVHYHRFCMHIRNQRLVDESDILLCYLEKESGGTANTARYAARKKKKIINLADLL